MTYAKHIIDGKLSALLTYDFTPEFGEDSDTVIITEEEYNMLMEELRASQPAPDPDNAPNLWNNINYVNGIRVIPDHIVVTEPFSAGEEGLDDDGVIWVSKYDNNVYTPTQYADNWEKKSDN